MSEVNNDIYPNFTGSKFDMRYARCKVLPSDLFKGVPITKETITRIIDREEEDITDELKAEKLTRTLVTEDLTVIPVKHSYLACDATDNPINIFLVDASTCKDKIFKIKKIDSTENAVAVLPFGSQTIENNPDYTMNIPNEGTTIISTGTNWEVIT